MFYLTTHSTHFIPDYMGSYIIMVDDHSDTERGNSLMKCADYFSLCSFQTRHYTIAVLGAVFNS